MLNPAERDELVALYQEKRRREQESTRRSIEQLFNIDSGDNGSTA